MVAPCEHALSSLRMTGSQIPRTKYNADICADTIKSGLETKMMNFVKKKFKLQKFKNCKFSRVHSSR